MVAVREPMSPLYAERDAAPQLARHEPSGLDREFDAQFDLGVSAQRKGDFQKAILHYTNAIKLDLRCPEAYINRAVAYESAGNLDLALQDTETALALEPKAEAYHNRGNINFKQDNYDLAVHDYGKSLELDPLNRGAYLYRAHALRQLGYLEDAIRDYEAVLAQYPTTADAYLGIGIVRNLMGDIDNAIRSFDKALEVDPTDPYIYLNRGGAWVARGDNESAERDFDKALRLDSKYSYAYVARGSILMGKGDLEGALRDVDHALHLNPSFAYPRFLRGLLYLQNDDLDRAIQDFDDAIERGLNSSNTYYSRGVAYEKKGDLSRAMQDYDQALRIRPNKEAFGNRGIALLRLSEWDRARSDLLKASNMGSDLTKLIPGGPEAVTEFEKEHNIELPQDLVEMLSVQEDLSTARAGESVLEIFRTIRESLPEGAFDDMPTDGARNYKHYLYGWPKR